MSVSIIGQQHLESLPSVAVMLGPGTPSWLWAACVLSGAAAEQLLEGPGPSCGDSEVQALREEEEELTSCGCVLSEVVGTTERSEDGSAYIKTRIQM